ncbi:MAG TPA: MFS transporter [Ktedonobacterales bacterium]|jgi:MFS family permease
MFGLWRHRDFLRLWIAQTVSLFGTQVTVLALPTVAILLLHASPFEVGVLAALPWLAYLCIGLIAGVIVDHQPRRRIMIAADLVRFATLGSIPLAFALGFQTIAQLYIVAAVVGISNVFFEVAYQAYLPALLEQRELVEGNGKLALGEAAAVTGGPAFGGLLIGAFGAATAMLADALSYGLSALFISTIAKHKEVVLDSGIGLKKTLKEIGEGIGLVLRHPIIRALASVSMLQNFGESVAGAMLLVFVYRDLHLSPTVVGLTVTVGSVGFLTGAAIVSAATRKLGIGPMLAVSSLLGAGAYLVLPLGAFGLPILWLGLWRLLLGLHLPTYNVNVISVRQMLVPDHMQGRVNATIRTIVLGVMGLGPLVGGLLGTLWGPAPTLICGGAIFLLGSFPLLTRAVISLKQHASPVAVA